MNSFRRTKELKEENNEQHESTVWPKRQNMTITFEGFFQKGQPVAGTGRRAPSSDRKRDAMGHEDATLFSHSD